MVGITNVCQWDSSKTTFLRNKIELDSVVSVGATRRFAFRDIPSDHENNDKNLPASQPHNFFVMGGDVTEMIHDCQSRFQHTVKTADDKNEVAARASLVFKRTMTTK